MKIKFKGFRWVLLLSLVNPIILKAQLTMLPSGGNKKASVSENVGITHISIEYSRPGVKGRTGKIWGNLIPVGYADLGFGNTHKAPWRAGANENTSMEFSTDVRIEGHDLPAGKYGFFIVYQPDACTLIFSKNSSSWGSYYYDPTEDALQVTVKPFSSDRSVEWLKYEFLDENDSAATIALEWEHLIIPFRVETDYQKNQLAAFRKELRSEIGFTWEPWNTAAQWCLRKNVNLDQALLWSDSATSVNFGGDQSFQAWSTKAMLLDKLGRTSESLAIMKKAIPFGTEQEIHEYGRQLLAQKRTNEAMETFKLNYDKHPNDFTTNMGMARGYSGLGNYKKALEFAKKAQAQATDMANKNSLEKLVKMLEEGKDIN